MRARLRQLTFSTCLWITLGCPGEGASGPTTEGSSTSTSTSASSSSGTLTPTGSSSTTGAPSGPPFTLTLLDDAWISGLQGWDSQHQDVPYDVGPGTFSKVTLVVDLESDCFPWEKWQTNPPPQDQNWPASCDAFDRTMGFISDPAADAASPPGFELLRAITPFGGPLHLEADITDYANAHPGAHTLRSYISSWPDGAGQVSGSAGGWHLSVRVEVEPGPAPRKVLAALSLFQADLGETPAPATSFSLPDGVAKVELEYRVSGHGGAADNSGDCIGPAEEFCRRAHHVSFDDKLLSSITPWRTDCDALCTITDNPLPVGPSKYCAENPCGAISSVQAPRANWCPGSIVEPFRGPVKGVLGPGPDHTFAFAIDGVVPGGLWTVSAVLFAYGP